MPSSESPAAPPPTSSVAVPEPLPEPQRLEFGARRPAVFYPARERASRPLTVMLHGMCAIPEWECPVFRAGATQVSWLICPAGPAGCSGEGGMWSGSPERLHSEIMSAASALARQQPEVDVSRKVLIGYSLGATAALGVIARSPGEWDGLMLVNAGLQPEPGIIRKSGVRRVALVAGARDGSRNKLHAAATRLTRAGIDARFFELDGTGHYFDASSEARMVEPVTWLLDSLWDAPYPHSPGATAPASE